VEAVVAVNEARKLAMARKIEAAFGGVKGKTIAVLGLTFKPNTDDMRDAPSIAISQALQDAGVAIAAYDPEGMEQARALMPGVEMKDDVYAAIEGADAVVIVTEWDAFRALDLSRVKELVKAPILVDLRNIYNPAEMRAAGFTYLGIGRGASAE
jgi:UDPglucose 6-dehydrogenase